MDEEVDESLKRGVDHLKTIFDLCDQDKDGCISAEEFRSIGLEHFGQTQEVDMLIREMDPANSQHISFTMFCQGIETYLIQHQQLPGSSSSVCSLSSCTEDNGSTAEVSSTGGYDSAFSSEDIYPLDHRFAAYLSHGYESATTRGAGVELVVEHSDDNDSQQKRGASRLSNMSPSPTHYTDSPVSVSRESPTLLAKHLMRRHNQLTLPESPSQGSTPAELVDEEVSKLSDQLCELSSKLEDLQEDHRDSEGFRNKLKRENVDLKMKLEEYEIQLRDTEENTQKMLHESQNLLNTSLVKVRRESEQEVVSLQSQLEISREQLQKMKDTEYSLRSQVSFMQEELSSRDSELSELEDSKRMIERELKKTREQLRMERESWLQEKETLKQDIHEREQQVQQLQAECEDAHKDRDRHSITASDMGREIERLKKELEQAHAKNEEMQAQFVQEGKELLARNRESLAAEMDNASKDEVLKALQDSDELIHRLQHYIDRLLTNIIEKYPELLEIR